MLWGAPQPVRSAVRLRSDLVNGYPGGPRRQEEMRWLTKTRSTEFVIFISMKSRTRPRC